MSSILIAILILVVVLTIISVVTTSSYLLTWKVVSQQNEKLIDSLSNISDKLKSSSISTDLEKSILILQDSICQIENFASWDYVDHHHKILDRLDEIEKVLTTRVEVLTDDHDESADNHSTNYEFLDLGQESIRQISEAENNESSSDIREFSVNFQEFDNFLKTNLDVGWEIKDEEIEASED